jgi:hypothetical protein
MREMPCRSAPILCAVLAERRQEYAVLELHAANAQLLEQLWDGTTVGLGVDCGARRRILRWREVGRIRGWLVDHVVGHGSSSLLGGKKGRGRAGKGELTQKVNGRFMRLYPIADDARCRKGYLLTGGWVLIERGKDCATAGTLPTRRSHAWAFAEFDLVHIHTQPYERSCLWARREV